MSGTIVARKIPLDETDACVNCVSFGFQPVRALFAECVSHGTIVDCAIPASVSARKTEQASRQCLKRLIS
jgi:hypothetical protein